MITPQEALRKCRENIKTEWKTAFAAAFVIGLLIHLPVMVSDIPNHDGLSSMYFDQNMITSGRWFLTVACGISSYFTLPWLIGLLALVYLASITYGTDGVLHGFKCKLLQDENGNVLNAYSAASGLDYPGVGPKHCFLKDAGRVNYSTVNDEEAINAFYELSKVEGIVPALESSHAVAYAMKLAKENPNCKILVNLSGRGDKDIAFITKYV